MDLLGIVSLSSTKDCINTPMRKTSWGYGNLKGETQHHSYYIELLEKEELSAGEYTKAKLRFKFGELPEFDLKLQLTDIIEMRDGARKIGEFSILEILNDKLVR